MSNGFLLALALLEPLVFHHLFLCVLCLTAIYQRSNLLCMLFLVKTIAFFLLLLQDEHFLLTLEFLGKGVFHALLLLLCVSMLLVQYHFPATLHFFLFALHVEISIQIRAQIVAFIEVGSLRLTRASLFAILGLIVLHGTVGDAFGAMFSN